jgi:tRNA pseudouridine38-40 synthase
MARYFIELAYKGTAYHGWQVQKNATGVQQLLNRALSLKLGEAIETTGSGRTDKGVHAMQQYAHFDFN